MSVEALYNELYETVMAYKKRAIKDMLDVRVFEPFDAHARAAEDAIMALMEHVPTFHATNVRSSPYIVAKYGPYRPTLMPEMDVKAIYYGDTEEYPTVYTEPAPNVKARQLPEVQRFVWQDYDMDEAWQKYQRAIHTIDIVLRGPLDLWDQVIQEPDWTDKEYGYMRAGEPYERDPPGWDIDTPEVVHDYILGNVKVLSVRGTCFVFPMNVTQETETGGVSYTIEALLVFNPQLTVEKVATGEQLIVGGRTILQIFHGLPDELTGFDVLVGGSVFRLRDIPSGYGYCYWEHKDAHGYRGWVYIGKT